MSNSSARFHGNAKAIIHILVGLGQIAGQNNITIIYSDYVARKVTLDQYLTLTLSFDIDSWLAELIGVL